MFHGAGVGGGKVFSSVGLTFVKQMLALVAELNSKLKKLERRVELVEATLHTVDQEPA